jgi:hypothetical protein
MKRRTRVFLQLASSCLTLCLALSASSFAASNNNAYLYLVHGIPGRDVADNLNPGLPIDVLIDGKCPVHGLTFGSTSGPLTITAGTYDVQISTANTLAPCTNPELIDALVTLTPGESLSAVAAISGTQLSVLQFTDKLSPVAPGNARFVLNNSADAPALQATLTQLGVKNPQTYIGSAEPDTQTAIPVLAGNYLVQITAVGSTTVLTSQEITLADQSVTYSYACGEAVNNSIGLVNRTIRDVF